MHFFFYKYSSFTQIIVLYQFFLNNIENFITLSLSCSFKLLNTFNLTHCYNKCWYKYDKLKIRTTVQRSKRKKFNDNPSYLIFFNKNYILQNFKNYDKLNFLFLFKIFNYRSFFNNKSSTLHTTSNYVRSEYWPWKFEYLFLFIYYYTRNYDLLTYATLRNLCTAKNPRNILVSSYFFKNHAFNFNVKFL
jgi:hypothetical protein